MPLTATSPPFCSFRSLSRSTKSGCASDLGATLLGDEVSWAEATPSDKTTVLTSTLIGCIVFHLSTFYDQNSGKLNPVIVRR
jgi:hypothetical protein